MWVDMRNLHHIDHDGDPHASPPKDRGGNRRAPMHVDPCSAPGVEARSANERLLRQAAAHTLGQWARRQRFASLGRAKCSASPPASWHIAQSAPYSGHHGLEVESTFDTAMRPSDIRSVRVSNQYSITPGSPNRPSPFVMGQQRGNLPYFAREPDWEPSYREDI
jgi:hypothetical protein